jgi:hypothetical protein
VDWQVVAYFGVPLEEADAQRFRAPLGASDHISVWEALALLVAARMWLPGLPNLRMQVRSDSLSALSAALALRSREPRLNAVARELALDTAEGRYQLAALQHTPGVANSYPDALSRLHDPTPRRVPLDLLKARRDCPPARDAAFWRTWTAARDRTASRRHGSSAQLATARPPAAALSASPSAVRQSARPPARRRRAQACPARRSGSRLPRAGRAAFDDAVRPLGSRPAAHPHVAHRTALCLAPAAACTGWAVPAPSRCRPPDEEALCLPVPRTKRP